MKEITNRLFDEKKNKVWVFQNEETSTKVVRALSASAKMIALFTSHNNSWTQNTKRKTSHNFSSWKRKLAHYISNYNSLFEEKNDLMSHCPYLPDLSPGDFFLFVFIKNKMRRHWFSNPKETTESFKSYVSPIQISEWHIYF